MGRGRWEVVALLLLFFALFLLLSLCSYILPLLQPEPVLQRPEANWCGSLGHYTAHYLLSFLGLMAFFPVGILLYAMVSALIRRPEDQRLPFLVAGISGIALSSSGLFGAFDELLLPSAYVRPGGHLGLLVWSLLGGVLGYAGSALTMGLLLVFSLMAAVRFSPLGLFVRMGQPRGAQRSSSPAEATREPELAPRKARSARTVRSTAEVREPVTPPPAMPAVHEPQQSVVSQEPGRRKASRKSANRSAFQLPPLTLLDENNEGEIELSREHYYEVSDILTSKLLDFGVQGTVAGISPGPVVTTYEFSPAPGVKINKIVTLADDLAMVLKVDRVRIVGSIPGKAAIGIEIPNPVRKTVFLRDILTSSAYQEAPSMLSLALGFDVIGRPIVANLARMPHLLIAGATGAGKSVAINAFISSILFKAAPEDVRLLLIDPKRIELSVYDDIPHLLHPVVVEAKMASRALLWAVREMERRYRLLEEKRVKSFASYNEVAEEKLPFIVIIVDELADLMMVASKDVETSIARLAQMAQQRACTSCSPPSGHRWTCSPALSRPTSRHGFPSRCPPRWIRAPSSTVPVPNTCSAWATCSFCRRAPPNCSASMAPSSPNRRRSVLSPFSSSRAPPNTTKAYSRWSRRKQRRRRRAAKSTMRNMTKRWPWSRKPDRRPSPWCSAVCVSVTTGRRG